MWTYQQSTGMLKWFSSIVGYGYSGCGDGKNNPFKQDCHNVGPLPTGRYTIESPVDTDAHGPYVLRLDPDEGNEMHGRAGFLIHGDSVAHPGTASQGCIIMPRAVREQVWQSGDHRLEVVA